MKQIYELPSGVSIEFQYEPGWEKFRIAWQSEEWGHRKPAFGLHRLYQRALFMDALSNAHSDFIGLVRLEHQTQLQPLHGCC